MRKLHLIAFSLCAASLFALAGADPSAHSFAQEGRKPRKPASELPVIKELPNPFQFVDGSPVKTKDDWARRRTEIKTLFEDYMYGPMPPRPKKITVKRGAPLADEASNNIVQILDVTLEHEGKSFTFKVTVALPMNAKGKVPVLIQSTNPFSKGGGGASGKRFKAFTDRGYAVAEFNWNAIAVDNKNSGGIYTLFGNDIDTGSLMGWAWGISRVIDALAEAVPEIDTTKVFITGHSRYGKAVLIAGAFDERIALTIPSHSGCAGVAPYRFIYGKSEQLHNIAGAFPVWFHPKFKEFVGNVDRLPVDQHLLLTLVAPRALMDTEGTKDAWTNPEGAQLVNLAARRVYKFLGAEDKISFRQRDVGHIPSNEDVLAFADYVFLKKALPAEFGKMAYKEETKAYSWEAPR